MAFNRDAIISALYTSPEVEAAISKMQPVELQEDLKQEMFVVLCKLPEAKLKEMYDKQYIKWFLVRTMTNMIMTDRSTFFNTHRRFREKLLSGIAYITTDGQIAKDSMIEEQFEDPGPNGKSFYRTPEGMITHATAYPDQCITERVNDAIADLDPYEAALIQLYAEMGGSCKPIAKATSISERGVRFAVAKAREKLQKKLRA